MTTTGSASIPATDSERLFLGPHNLPDGWRCVASGVYASDDGWTVARAKPLGYRSGFAIMRTDGGRFRFASTHEERELVIHETLHAALRMLVEPAPNGDAWYVAVAS